MRLVRELGERLVDPDCLLRVVVPRRAREEDPDHREEHHSRRMAEEACGVHERPGVFPLHLAPLEVLAELPVIER